MSEEVQLSKYSDNILIKTNKLLCNECIKNIIMKSDVSV